MLNVSVFSDRLGDLKTYLLSRRQLVNGVGMEAKDIGPEGLTRMALDVASGLKYLSELKYVHRQAFMHLSTWL